MWQFRVAAFGALCIFGLTPVWVAAQIVPSLNAGAQKPAVATTPSGIPLVQISRPSAAGVSNNQYSQFSVGRAGAVLNNSPTSVQSQLAGWIPGNANLTSPAKIILNQVTGNIPSMLAGQIEVAGRKAEVVIANSAGITCSGCGFINTSRGILTTGTPVIGPSGSLDAFRVTSGTVSLTGAGLNASNLDQVDVIARAVSVNASVFANLLNVITGTNQVDQLSITTASSTVFNEQTSAVIGQYSATLTRQTIVTAAGDFSTLGLGNDIQMFDQGSTGFTFGLGGSADVFQAALTPSDVSGQSIASVAADANGGVAHTLVTDTAAMPAGSVRYSTQITANAPVLVVQSGAIASSQTLAQLQQQFGGTIAMLGDVPFLTGMNANTPVAAYAQLSAGVYAASYAVAGQSVPITLLGGTGIAYNQIASNFIAQELKSHAVEL